MGSAARRRAAVALASIAILGSGCGGDTTGPGTPGQPQPPAGSATRVPRILALSTVDGMNVPTMHYQSTTTASDVWTDSGSATIQDDSMLVVRTYSHIVPHGASRDTSGTAFPFTTAGRLTSDGIALFRYTDGTVDTARVQPNGAISAQLTITDGGAPHPFGKFLFAGTYRGGALNPMPLVRAITPDTVPQLADSAVVTFTGSSFTPGIQALWGGSTPLTVRYAGPYQFTVIIPKSLLLSAGHRTISIVNPAPGGGTRIYALEVTIAEPAIMSTSPTSMVAAGGDFTLHVHGRGFTDGTHVLWNGAPRTAIASSATDLTATIPSSDIPTAGTYQVAVQTTPTSGMSGGGTSGVVAFTVTGPPAQKYAEVTTHFASSTLVADPVRTVVYAVASFFEKTYANSVAAIDATSGQISWTLDMGGPTGAAAISDDGAYLYVAAPQDSVVRISLATHAVDLVIPLPPTPHGHPNAIGLAVVPGQPRSVAVLRSCGGCNGDPSAAWIFEIYDDAQRRPQAAGVPTSPIGFAFTSPQTLHSDTDGNISSYAITPTGIALQAQNVAAIGLGDVAFGGSRVYTNYGNMYDFTTHASSQISMFPPTGIRAMAPSSDGQLLYTTAQRDNFVRALDTGTGVVVGAVSYTKPSVLPDPGLYLVRWGTDGLAFSTGFDTYFIRASFVH